MSLFKSVKLALIHPFFNADRYLKANPDVAAAGMNAWTHYSMCGINESRSAFPLQYVSYGWWYNVLRQHYRNKYRAQIERCKGKRVLVHAHLYYMEAWCEMEEYLRNIAPYDCDFIITYTADRRDDAVIARVEQSFKGIKVIPTANKGFDIGPFFEVLHEVNLDDYAVVYHVHSKSFSQGIRINYGKAFAGKEWFTQMYSAVLGVENVHKCMALLTEGSQGNVGMVGAENVFFDDLPQRIRLVKEYAKRFNVTVPEQYQFIGGTCFAAPAAALKTIQAWGIRLDDFETSTRGVFTLAHAVERLIPIEMENLGFRHHGIKVACKEHREALDAREAKVKEHGAAIIAVLQKHGFTEVKTLNLGIRSGLRCSFFSGVYNGQECFIKWGGKEEACANEVKMLKLTSPLSPHFLPLITHAITPEYRFVATPLLRGYDANQMIQFGLAQEDCDTICAVLEELKGILHANHLLHRDIHPLNVYFTEDKKVYLLDLQFMVQLDENGEFEEFTIIKEDEHRRLVLGSAEFQKAPGEWDDAVSIDKTIAALRRHVIR